MGAGRAGQGETQIEEETEEEYEENLKALRSWVRPVAMVTAARRDEQQTDKTRSLSQSPPLSLAQRLVGS